MTQEEKNLLIKDLCSRLPHKQKVCYKIHDNSEEITETLSGCLLDYFKTGKIAVVKAYLRPLTSMSEDEEIEFCMTVFDTVLRITEKKHTCLVSFEQINWLDAHHFDYRGLIEKGLALEAPEGLYNF